MLDMLLATNAITLSHRTAVKHEDERLNSARRPSRPDPFSQSSTGLQEQASRKLGLQDRAASGRKCAPPPIRPASWQHARHQAMHTHAVSTAKSRHGTVALPRAPRGTSGWLDRWTTLLVTLPHTPIFPHGWWALRPGLNSTDCNPSQLSHCVLSPIQASLDPSRWFLIHQLQRTLCCSSIQLRRPPPKWSSISRSFSLPPCWAVFR